MGLLGLEIGLRRVLRGRVGHWVLLEGREFVLLNAWVGSKLMNGLHGITDGDIVLRVLSLHRLSAYLILIEILIAHVLRIVIHPLHFSS